MRACKQALGARIIDMMEGIGMFSSGTVSQLANVIYANLDTRQQPALAARANSLGLPVREGFTAERIIFTLAQAIVNLLDEISPEGEQQRRWRQGGRRDIEGHSTLNSAPNCLSGNLNLAALVFGIFCPRLTIWDILDLISSAREDLQREEGILQDVRLQERVLYLPNMRSSYSCHCLVFSDEPHLHALQPQLCTFCGKEYHGECQPNALFCNCCFLRFCMFDLREEMGDAYNHGKEVDLAYFTYIENAYSRPHPPDQECVYFLIAKFTLPDINNLEKREKAFYVKMAMVDRIFTGELAPPVVSGRGRGRQRPVKHFWEVDETQYYLYLNHNEIKVTNVISDCAVIFKVLPRALLPSTNILILKCVKRNLKYSYAEQDIPYFREEERESGRPKIIMMGVYQTNKIRASKQNKNKTSTPTPTLSKNIIPDLTIGQSISFLEYVLKKINKIEYQIVDLIDVNSGEKIINPVRSYSCTHVECFDFEQFRHKIKPSNYKSKTVLKKRKVPIDVDVDEEEENNVIDLDSNSVVAVEVQPKIIAATVPRPTLTPLQRRKEFLRRKRQRERREKDSLYCPICNKRMLSLYIDPLFKSILLNSGFYTRVRVFSNGEFNFEASPKAVIQ